MTLAEQVRVGSALEAIERHLDGLDPVARIRECRALSGAELAKLFALAESAGPLRADDLVSDGKTVRYAGKNSLPALRYFEKHFARCAGQVVGINVQTMSFATGPGYFTCTGPVEGRSNELLFDYTQVPPSGPEGWPAPRSNSQWISRFVFHNLHDHNRRVSREVVIGSATKLGKPMNQYYILARLD